MENGVYKFTFNGITDDNVALETSVDLVVER